MEHIDDSTLVEQLANPDTQRKAFEMTVNKYSSRLYWHIRRMVLSHDDANDILQNTFIKAWTNIDNFRAESKLSSWLYRIAINESLTFLQRRKETVALDDPEFNMDNALESDPYFDGDETQLHLQKAIMQLPDKQRAVFILKYMEEKKYEEISEILNTSVGTLKASYHFAVQKIEKYFSNID